MEEKRIYEKQDEKDIIISKFLNNLNILYQLKLESKDDGEKVIEIFLKNINYINIELYAKAIHSFAINTVKNNERLVIFFCFEQEKIDYSIISLFIEYSNIFFQRIKKKSYFSVGTIFNKQKDICFSVVGVNEKEIYQSAREYSYSNFDAATKLLQISKNHFYDEKENSSNNEMNFEMPVELYVKNSISQINEDLSDNVNLNIGMDVYAMPVQNFNGSIFLNKIRELLEMPLNAYDCIKKNGCKISNVHVRLGAKIHIENFYEAEILFHNANNVRNFAYIIAKDISIQYKKQFKKDICLIGYESYSELLVKQIKKYLNNFIGENKIETFYYYNKKTNLHISDNAVVYIIVPIGSTLSTFYKIISDMEIKTSILANYHYVLTLVRDTIQSTETEIEKKFWIEEPDYEKENNIVKLNVAYEKPDLNLKVKYLLSVEGKWKQAENCELCYPKENAIDERSIFHVDKTSTLPKLVFDLFNSNRKGIHEGLLENDDIKIQKNYLRLDNLKGCIRYGHIENENNHFIYYIDTKKVTDNACNNEFDSLSNWARQLKGKFQEQYDIENRFNILVSPLNNTNGEFLNIILSNLFGNCYRFFHFSIKDSLREDIRAKFKKIAEEFKESEDYAHIHQLVKENKVKRINCFYLDDIIVSGETFDRAQTLLSMLAKESGINSRFNAFDAIITLINRNSYDSVNHLIQSPEKNFFSYIHLNIPTLKREQGKCPNCLLDTTYKNMMKFVVNDKLREKFRNCYNKQKKVTVSEFDENIKSKQHSIINNPKPIKDIETYIENYYVKLDILDFINKLKNQYNHSILNKFIIDLNDNSLTDFINKLSVSDGKEEYNTILSYVNSLSKDTQKLQNQKSFMRLKSTHIVNSAFDAYFQATKYKDDLNGLSGNIFKHILNIIFAEIDKEIENYSSKTYKNSYNLFAFTSTIKVEINALIRFKLVEIILSFLKSLSRPMASKSYYVRDTVLKFSILLLEIIQFKNKKYNLSILNNYILKTLEKWQIIIWDNETQSLFLFLCGILLCNKEEKINFLNGKKHVELKFNSDIDPIQLYIFYFDILENISFLDSTYVIREETISQLFDENGLVRWFIVEYEKTSLSKEFSKEKFKEEIILNYQFIAKWAVTYNEEISRSVLLEKNLNISNSKNDKLDIIRSLILENTTIIYNSIDSLLNKTILKTDKTNLTISNKYKNVYNWHVQFIEDKFENNKVIEEYLYFNDASSQNEFSAFYSYIYKYLPFNDLSEILSEDANHIEELKTFIINLLKYYTSIKIALDKHVIDDLRNIYGAIATFMMEVSFANAISFSLCDEKRQKEDMILWRIKEDKKEKKALSDKEKSVLLKYILNIEENGIPTVKDFKKSIYDGENKNPYNNFENEFINIMYLKIPVRIKRNNVFEEIEGEEKFILIMLYYMKSSNDPFPYRIENDMQKLYRAKSVLFVKNRLIDIFSLDYAKISTKEFLQVKPFDIEEKHILHITDLHYEEKNSQRIIEGLEKVLKYKYDIITITGDIVNAAFQAIDIDKRYMDFYEAFKLLLANIYGDEWDNRILLVPGNHDYSSMNEGISRIDARNLKVIVPPSILSEANASIKFAYYLNFASHFMKKIRSKTSLENDLCIYNDDYEEFGFGFILLNTASLSSSHRQNKVGIKKEILKKLDEFLKEKNKVSEKNLMLIALMHHTPMFDADYLVDKGGGEIGKIISPLVDLLKLINELGESKNKNRLLKICSEVINIIINENFYIEDLKQHFNDAIKDDEYDSTLEKVANTIRGDDYFPKIKRFSKTICQWAFETNNKDVVHLYDKFNLSGFMFLYYLYKKLLEQRDNNISYFSSIEEATKILEMLGINDNIIFYIESYTGSLKDFPKYMTSNFISNSKIFNIEILFEIAKDYWASIYDQDNLDEIKQVLVKHNVKLILGGHNHIYQDNAGKDGIRIIEGAIFYDSQKNEISYNEVKITTNKTFEVEKKVIKNEEKNQYKYLFSFINCRSFNLRYFIDFRMDLKYF